MRRGEFVDVERDGPEVEEYLGPFVQECQDCGVETTDYECRNGHHNCGEAQCWDDAGGEGLGYLCVTCIEDGWDRHEFYD